MKKVLFVMFLLMLFSVDAQVLHNTTNITSADNVYEQALAVNDIVDGTLGLGLLLAIMVITFIITSGKTQSFVSAAAMASYFGAFTSTIFLPLGFIQFTIYKMVILVCGVVAVLSIFLSRLGF